MILNLDFQMAKGKYNHEKHKAKQANQVCLFLLINDTLMYTRLARMCIFPNTPCAFKYIIKKETFTEH